MRYPSELLQVLADKTDTAENWVLERDWRFWRWAETAAEVEQLRKDLRTLVADYAKLRSAYMEKTGKEFADESNRTRWILNREYNARAISTLKAAVAIFNRRVS